MSKIALLVGAVPERCSQGPIVRLLAGSWLVHIEHIVDSALQISVGGLNLDLFHGAELRLPATVDVQLTFARRGKEPFINVFAERVT